MILLIALACFVAGFTLGKRRKPQRFSVRKKGDVSGVKNFLTYDGTEQE